MWRFGSTIGGRLHATSDLDVLVVQRTDLDPVTRGLVLRDTLGSLEALDLFVVTPDEMSRGGRFVDHVRAHGRLVR